MKAIGIIANPASGKDIRRLVSHATVVDNNEKVNIVKRIILSAQGCGVDRVFIMPDTFLIGYKAIEDLKISKELKIDVEILNMKIKGNVMDTIRATKIMEEKGVKCLVVLGGDGTNRAVAKSITTTPLIGVSTGTNNVYPEMLEGTVVGMAAGVVATGACSIDQGCKRDKRIEIFKDGQLIDIALVDCVISRQKYVGSKAIWNIKDIDMVIVSRAHPASIGFSTIVGTSLIVGKDDDFGALIHVNSGNKKVRAPIAAGTIEEIRVDEPRILKLDEAVCFKPTYNGIMALDGEREVPFKVGENIEIKITSHGPYRVIVDRILELAQKNGFFET
ncbi:MAG: ATP-NAD kinase [Tissierellia bacterium]|nr:ATP-NAD kinase [Tissierellia bacterium]